jgi:diaminopimelate decarboxylase
MRLGGIDAAALAEHFGTPLLALDLDVLDKKLAELLAAAAPHNIGISYAGKALLVPGLVRHLHPHPIGIDTCSLGEIAVTERGGFEAARLTLHGAGKTAEEHEAVFAGRVGRIVIDGMDELRAFCARSKGRGADVILRFNTGVEARTLSAIRTAGERSKFGLAPSEESAALALLREYPALHLRGVHAHMGSQLYDATVYIENARALLAILERTREIGFERADTIVIGGGFGVQMIPGATEQILDVAGTLAAVARVVPSGVRVEIEPGRRIVAEAGTSLYRVAAVKRFATHRFVIVDGGMADNPRPALYDAYHHVVALRETASPLTPAILCGRSCESDELGDVHLPDDLEAGDLLAMLAAGAYTYAMASNYNWFARPALVAVSRGNAELWAPRESIETMMQRF